jgi:hypothetical protein
LSSDSVIGDLHETAADLQRQQDFKERLSSVVVGEVIEQPTRHQCPDCAVALTLISKYEIPIDIQITSTIKSDGLPKVGSS